MVRKASPKKKVAKKAVAPMDLTSKKQSKSAMKAVMLAKKKALRDQASKIRSVAKKSKSARSRKTNEKYVFGPFKHSCSELSNRIDLEIYGIEHFRPTYQVEFFFNDPDVEAKSSSKDLKSFAGKITVFGHSHCTGDEGHCDANRTPRRFGDTRSHHLTKAFKRITVTDAISALKANSLTITAIVTPLDEPDPGNKYEKLFDIQGMQLVSFE